MKIWKSYGSAHSAHLTVIGEFARLGDAQLASDVVEDFVNASWEERYPDVAAFLKAWTSRLPAVEFLGPDQSDFDLGLDRQCDIAVQDNIVTVSGIRGHRIDGIVKLLLLNDPSQVRIVGRTGP